MVIAETLVGIQLVKASVSGIKEVINTCQDISELSHHIDNVFSGQEHVEKKIADKKKKAKSGIGGKWQTFIGSRLGGEEGDGTSIQEIAAEIIEHKQAQKEIRNMSLMLNKRFGADTWTTIIKTRQERIKERDERLKQQAQEAKEQAWENKRKWKKIGEESGKLAIVAGVIVAMYFYISYACKGCI
jgi:hypothetical protein|tara:strand:+ start:1839 stop:2396 length:558 start_codon:yes stop_codon:yes gene_type:complete